MNTPFGGELDPDEAMISELLASADVREIDPSEQVVDRVRAALRERTVSCSVESRSGPSLWRHRRVSFLSLSAVVVVLVAGLIYDLRSNSSWAQVTATVRSQPWIHLKAVGEKGQRRELWLSFPRDMSAMQDGDYARFDDYRAGVRYEFNPQANKLFRLPISQSEEFQSMVAVFQSIFRGDIVVGDRFAEDRIVEQKRRTIEDQGQTWTEYELKLQRGDQSATVVIRVNPATKLPTFMTLTAGKEQMRYDFKYPDQGPADICALGVSRDLAVVDRVPPADVAQVLRAQERGQRELDNYFAVVCRSPLVPSSLVWRKGDKWRVELCVPTDRVQPTKPMEPGGDSATWWHERLKQFDVLPLFVCDGRRLHKCEFKYKDNKAISTAWVAKQTVSPGEGHDAARSFGDSSEALVEFRAYPKLIPSSLFSVTLDPQGKDGPPGSVLVEMVATAVLGDRAYRKMQYWCDPQRQYAVVKSELSDNPSLDNDPQTHPAQKHVIHELGDFRQSPRGVWYPTVVRWKNAGGARKNKQGEMEDTDQLQYFHLDFNAALPDELFAPTMRKPIP